MKVKVLKSSDNELKMEVEGAGHSLLNLLQKTLLEDDTIEMAGYDVPHLRHINKNKQILSVRL
jgi:DNA-directed RNA polymerase subunit L